MSPPDTHRGRVERALTAELQITGDIARTAGVAHDRANACLRELEHSGQVRRSETRVPGTGRRAVAWALVERRPAPSGDTRPGPAGEIAPVGARVERR